MSLLNIQGDVQNVAIGLLLILSILLPNLPRIASSQRTKMNARALILAAIAVLVAIAFGWFFLWSRAVVFAL